MPHLLSKNFLGGMYISFCSHCTLAKVDFTPTNWFIEPLTKTYSHGTACSAEFLQSLNLVSNKAVLWLCAQVTIIHHFPVMMVLHYNLIKDLS